MPPPGKPALEGTAINTRLCAHCPENPKEKVEAREGFEPSNGGFADLSLRPLGYRAQSDLV